MSAQIRWQFVLGQGWSSRLIAWWGSGYRGYSHVDAILPDGSCLGARSDVITPKGQVAIPAGVEIRPPAYEKWKRRTVVTLSVTDIEAKAWEDCLKGERGKPYDSSDILGLIIGRPLSSDGHWICSALQTYALEQIGRLPKLSVIPQQVSPNTLLTVLSALGATMVQDAIT